MSFQDAQNLQGTDLEFLGPGLALMGAFCASCYLLLGQAAQRRGLSVLQYSTVAYGTAGLLLALAVSITGGWPTWTPTLVLIVVAMALGPQIFGHTSINGLLRVWRSSSVATLILLEPVGAGIFAGIFLNEWPSTSVLVGASVVLGGVLWTIRIQEN
jgi:drug/metabolite transporter (DMT)-like permease